jgi:DNA polymerase-3 subunit alpha
MPKILKDQDPSLRQKYEKRLARELDIIKSMGFAGYFLIVSDFINYAKSRNIPVGPGRGSAAGSLVAYALGITAIAPIRYGLFCERFRNPARKRMPDIDTDFCMEGRDEVIRYVSEKYGSDRVAQIITFGKMQAKAVIRDVGRALNMPYGEVDRIAKLVPNVLNITLEEAIKQEPRLQEEQKKNEKSAASSPCRDPGRPQPPLLDPRGGRGHLGQAARRAGPPVQEPQRGHRNPVFHERSSAAGLTKFDFLGLKTLTVIRDALKFIKEGRGVHLDISDIPLEDRKTSSFFPGGDRRRLPAGKPRDEGDPRRPQARLLRGHHRAHRPLPSRPPEERDGPGVHRRKQGKTKSTYEVPALEPILKETYGVILYQEQVMQIASALASYTMGEADTFRKAMSKKNSAEMEKEKPKFMAGALKNRSPRPRRRGSSTRWRPSPATGSTSPTARRMR